MSTVVDIAVQDSISAEAVERLAASMKSSEFEEHRKDVMWVPVDDTLTSTNINGRPLCQYIFVLDSHTLAVSLTLINSDPTYTPGLGSITSYLRCVVYLICMVTGVDSDELQSWILVTGKCRMSTTMFV